MGPGLSIVSTSAPFQHLEYTCIGNKIGRFVLDASSSLFALSPKTGLDTHW